MKTKNPWRMPKKIDGRVTPNITFRLDPLYKEALDQVAKRESQRLGVKISRQTLIVNLTTRDSNFFRMKRTEVREALEQLNKEQRREHQAQHPSKQETP